jgi:hypothetical protein
MAIWQFDFHLIPAVAVGRHFGVMPVTLPLDAYDAVDWWYGLDPFRDFEQDLSQLLPRGRSWSSQRDTWGHEDGDRFDVSREGTRIVDVFARLDLRTLSRPFLDRVLETIRRHDLLIVVAEDGHVLRPSMEESLAAIRRSAGFRFITDPHAFFRELAKTEAT